jgi:hypothetical protein
MAFRLVERESPKYRRHGRREKFQGMGFLVCESRKALALVACAPLNGYPASSTIALAAMAAVSQNDESITMERASYTGAASLRGERSSPSE